jgi:hypothetical protein
MSDAATQKLAEILYASSNLLALPFEKSFNPTPYIKILDDNWPVAFAIVTVYLLVIFGGQHIMKDYKPFDLRLSLASWNAFLCVFSFLGMIRTVSPKIIRFYAVEFFFYFLINSLYDI